MQLFAPPFRSARGLLRCDNLIKIRLHFFVNQFCLQFQTARTKHVSAVRFQLAVPASVSQESSAKNVQEM